MLSCLDFHGNCGICGTCGNAGTEGNVLFVFVDAVVGVDVDVDVDTDVDVDDFCIGDNRGKSRKVFLFFLGNWCDKSSRLRFRLFLMAGNGGIAGGIWGNFLKSNVGLFSFCCCDCRWLWLSECWWLWLWLWLLLIFDVVLYCVIGCCVKFFDDEI